MTKDIIRKSLELVKTDKMSGTGEILYDVRIFLNFLFGTIIRAKYHLIWESIARVYTIVNKKDDNDPRPCTFTKNLFTFEGYLMGSGVSQFIEELDKIFDDEDREDIETLLPLTKRCYRVWLDNIAFLDDMIISEPDIIPYLMRREDKVLYTIKTCLML